MSNLTSGVNEENQSASLAIWPLIHGGDAISAIEEEVLPSVEDITPRNPDAKPNFYPPPMAMVEVFQSSITAKCLVKFKAKYGLLDQLEFVPTDYDEVHAYHHGYCAPYAYPFTIG